MFRVRYEIEPEPTEAEREAIAAALHERPDGDSEWLEAARLEAVEADEP